MAIEYDPVLVKAAMRDALALVDDNQTELARRINAKQPVIHRICKTGRISPRYARKIHDFTNGKVARWQLRPDIFPSPEQEVMPDGQRGEFRQGAIA